MNDWHNLIAALAVAFPAVMSLRCFSVIINWDKPQGSKTDRNCCARSRARLKVVHGGAMLAPHKRLDVTSSSNLRKTCGFVRSQLGPCRMSNSLAANPSFRAALATPPVPAKKSPMYRPCSC